MDEVAKYIIYSIIKIVLVGGVILGAIIGGVIWLITWLVNNFEIISK